MAKPSNKESVAVLVTHAYLQLVNVRWNQDGSRSSALARYGNYEVRLIEFLPTVDKSFPPLLIEIHDVGTQTTVDSIGCEDFEGAILAAERAISQAKRLADRSAQS